MDSALEQRLERIEILLGIERKNVLTAKEVAVLTNKSENRIYHLVSSREIPHYKQGKKTYFRRSEIEDWMLQDRVPTNQEIYKKGVTHVTLNSQ